MWISFIWNSYYSTSLLRAFLHLVTHVYISDYALGDFRYYHYVIFIMIILAF